MIVVSYGGGTNSTALLVGLVERGEGVDLILFADTGGERPETYDYVNEFSDWLERRRYPRVQVVRREGASLETDCLSRAVVPSIAYGRKSCSDKFKLRPQNKFVSEHPAAQAAWARGEQVLKLIGFDADEPQRAGDFSTKRYAYRYPLIEWGWGRAACVEAIARAELPQPGKSSCFFCPSMKKHEIIALGKEHPKLAQRAIAIERGADLHSRKSTSSLGRTFSWEALLDADERQQKLFPESRVPVTCACFDGSEDE